MSGSQATSKSFLCSPHRLLFFFFFNPLPLTTSEGEFFFWVSFPPPAHTYMESEMIARMRLQPNACPLPFLVPLGVPAGFLLGLVVSMPVPDPPLRRRSCPL